MIAGAIFVALDRSDSLSIEQQLRGARRCRLDAARALWHHRAEHPRANLVSIVPSIQLEPRHEAVSAANAANLGEPGGRDGNRGVC